MTRECRDDFLSLENYIKSYNIKSNLNAPEYKAFLKQMHSCYFSSITWAAELQHGQEAFLNLEPRCHDEIIVRLLETVSDLGSTLFNWINGNYKTSKVMLRVAIENFIRSISAIEDHSQLSEKNVYSLFDIASAQSIFTIDKNIKSSFSSLHSDYKVLCQDAHTATFSNMEQKSSLSDFPAHDTDKSKVTASIFKRTSQNINFIFCALFNEYFHSMHHRNKENILVGVHSSAKPFILAKEKEHD